MTERVTGVTTGNTGDDSHVLPAVSEGSCVIIVGQGGRRSDGHVVSTNEDDNDP